jgi:hypothetical protein
VLAIDSNTYFSTPWQVSVVRRAPLSSPLALVIVCQRPLHVHAPDILRALRFLYLLSEQLTGSLFAQLRISKRLRGHRGAYLRDQLLISATCRLASQSDDSGAEVTAQPASLLKQHSTSQVDAGRLWALMLCN